MTTKKKHLKEKAVQVALKAGGFRLTQKVHRNYLTVLNYHRVNHKYFGAFTPNISATPQAFAEQMELVSRWFNVVSSTDIIAWLRGERSLPPHAALITFDDGYLDNYTQAFPILDEFNFPALIFLTTDHIDTDRPFFWDLIAYCFWHTKLDHIKIPVLGDVFWNSPSQIESIIHKFSEIVKHLPENEKQEIINLLPEKLDISIPHNTFRNLMVSWDQVRELNSKGIEFGGHTMTHPILSQVTQSQARHEIEGAKKRIETEIGEEISSFAYPNGQEDDFNLGVKEIVAQAKYQVAFSLVNGPASYKSVQDSPFEIRRIFISHKDTLPRFAFKICGINRLGLLG